MSKLPFEDKAVAIPSSVAVCPYCQGRLSAQPTAWEEKDGGTGYNVSEIDLDCENETEEEEGPVDHTYMPYVYWLPVHTKVLKWLNSAEALEMQEVTG